MKILCDTCGRFLRYEEPFANFAVQTDSCPNSPCPHRLQKQVSELLGPRDPFSERGKAIVKLKQKLKGGDLISA